MAKPSWCLEVMTRYFMPASLASCTHSSALNLTGLNCLARSSYSAIGIRARFMIHSPMPGMGLRWLSDQTTPRSGVGGGRRGSLVALRMGLGRTGVTAASVGNATVAAGSGALATAGGAAFAAAAGGALVVGAAGFAVAASVTA